ncbi:MAG: ABC transporter permease [Lachnospiraceae bacterium]
MTVFKGYLLIIKRNLPSMLLYFAIFLAISIGIQLAVGDEPIISFEAERLQVGVINEDGGELADGLIEYIGQAHDIVPLENDQSEIQEQLFYRNVQYVITIPEDFQEKCLNGNEKLTTNKIPGTFYIYYAELRIDDYLNGVRVYQAAGYSVSEAIELLIDQGQNKAQVDILDVNGNNGEVKSHMYLLVYYPYLFLTAICFSVSFVMLVYRDREIRRRMQSSPVSLVKQNVAGGLALGLVGLTFLCVCLILPVVMYGNGFLNDPHLGYLVLNLLMLLLVSLAIAFLVGVVAYNRQVVNNIVNGVSLGMSFLGGVFVSVDILGDNVKKVAQFLPVYWYESNLDLLNNYASLSNTVKLDLYKGYGIQFAFAAACIGIALGISKYRTQEN